MTFSKVLTILDKPKHASTALSRATHLQNKSGCHLDLVSFCWQSMGDSGEIFDAHQTKAIRDEILRERREWQRQLVLDAGCSMRDVSLKTVWTDDIATWVHKQTASKSYDLVVKSIHRSKTLTHTPLDWQLLRTCSAPMLFTSKRQQRQRPGGKVLAAVDMRHNDARHTKLNRKVLAQAYAIADLYGAELHCVTAIEISQVLRDLDIVDTRSVKKKIVAGFQDHLDKLVEPYSIPKSRMHFPVGKVGQAVTQEAAKIKANLLVVGTLAHRTKQALGLGNSAEKIITRSPVDLLAVPPG
jgi:universal stress protein E